MDTAVNLTPIFQAVIAVLGLVITGLAGIYVPKAIAAFEARTGIVLTENQRATVLGAVGTAAGLIETRLDQGVMKVAHVDIANDQVRALARAAIDSVPQASAALGVTVESVAKMIVGVVDTAAHGTAPVKVGVGP